MQSSPNTTEVLQRVSPMHLSHCCCQKVGLTSSSIVAQSNDKHDTTSSCTAINNILMQSSPNTTEAEGTPEILGTTSTHVSESQLLSDNDFNFLIDDEVAEQLGLIFYESEMANLSTNGIVTQSDDELDTPLLDNISMKTTSPKTTTTGNKENSANQIQGNSPASRKRKLSRRNCCPYCKRLITNFG
ncbi:uncharacterized protein LOC120350625 [Nilaparvata lugens]|uniref:uncharacterized protein LOC120350625 n=1 Tax=Nilaparvata lugens TaxID=108931 RepID=UPI00193DD490|nr:uncharacterized protein LOC120350625 [Nilaparvata lugens]